MTLDSSRRGEVQIVTGFLGRGQATGAVTTLGRGGSDLTATVIGAALGLQEVQVWKDVDGKLLWGRNSPANSICTFESSKIEKWKVPQSLPHTESPRVQDFLIEVSSLQRHGRTWIVSVGVLTSDPRIVSDARPVPRLTYEEATELAFFGATVLHPSAMQPALQFNNMGVRVKNSYNRQAHMDTAATLKHRVPDSACRINLHDTPCYSWVLALTHP